jgi:hypothetical protein
MAYDSKPGWSGLFVRNGTTGRAATGLTMSDAIGEFLEAVDDGSARDRYGRAFGPESARELHWSLGGHVGEELGTMSLRAVTRQDVEALLYELADAGLSPRRLRALARSIRALYDYAAEQDLVRSNPAERVAIPDDDEMEQPTERIQIRSAPEPGGSIADRVISLALRLATLALILVALAFIAESL